MVLYIEYSEEDKEKYQASHEVLGFVSAYSRDSLNINGNKIYTILGTSGSYPGLGSLVYSSLLYAIKDANEQPAFLVSDRDSISGEAERLYEKMNASDNISSISIPPSHNLFSEEIECDAWDIYCERLDLGNIVDYDDYLDLLEKGEVQNTHLNKGYAALECKESRAFHSKLTSQHERNNVAEREVAYLLECGRNMGEFVMDEYESLKDEVKKGFPSFKPITEPEESLSFA